MTCLSSSNRQMVSVVVPVLNEEMNLDRFYAELASDLRDLSDWDWEFIFVDDGSTDRSANRILTLRENDARIKLLRLSRNFGSHAALRAGLSYASGHAAIIISADLQDPTDMIAKFLAKWREGYDMVWGLRQSRMDPWSKKILAGLFYRLCRRVALSGFPEGGLDFGLFDRRVVDEFLRIKDHHGYVFATMLWMGFRQAFVPYARRARAAGVSKWSFTKRLKAAIDIMVSFSYVPIRFMSSLGITVSVLSLMYAGWLVVETLFFGRADAGWPSLMVAILFFGGVQLTMMGILGEYVWRGTDQVKGRPPFIVMEKIGFALTKEKEEEPAELVSGRVHSGSSIHE